jgi:hypothetical protein
MRFQPIQFLILASLVSMPAGGQASRAQEVSIGVKGGVVLNNDMRDVSRGQSESDRGEFGPVVEFEWPSGFAVEVSAIYRRVGYNSIYYGIPADVTNRVRATSWEVPIAAKYYFACSKRNTRAFVSGGYAFRALAGATSELQTFSYPENEPVQLQGAAYVKNSLSPGLTFGGGVQIASGRLRFTPEFRYTRWILLPFDEEGSKGYQIHSAANQLNFRISIAFVARKATRVP